MEVKYFLITLLGMLSHLSRASSSGWQLYRRILYPVKAINGLKSFQHWSEVFVSRGKWENLCHFIEFCRKLKRWSPHKYRRQCKENEQILPIKVRKPNFVANLKKLYVVSDIKLLEMERKWSFSCRDHLSLPRADYGFAPEHHHGQRAFNGFTNFQTAEW